MKRKNSLDDLFKSMSLGKTKKTRLDSIVLPALTNPFRLPGTNLELSADMIELINAREAHILKKIKDVFYHERNEPQTPFIPSWTSV